jgi:hypothetical protein
VLAPQQQPLAGLLAGQDAGEQSRPVRGDRPDELLRARGDVGVAVDLAVRVPDGHADLLAAVLEREDLLDPGQRGQGGGAVGPGLDDGARPGPGQAAEGSLGGRAEAHHLAPADGRG